MEKEKDLKELFEETLSTIQNLSKLTPDKMRAFHNFLGVVMKDGALSTKVKELIALALAIGFQCPYCMAFHLNKAIEAGATKEEILEAVWVAILMHGGPACTYSTLILKGLEELSDKKT